MYFDEIIIGSGPSAMGYLVGLKTKHQRKRDTLLISSGVTNNNIKKHPKLCKDSGCVVNPNNNIGLNIPGATSAFGGLSNSWGGVLIKLTSDMLKKSYDFIGAEDIGSYYKLIVDELRNDINVNAYQKNSVYIIDGINPYDWENSGISITPTLSRLINQLGIKTQINYTVNTINLNKGKYKWELIGNEGKKKENRIYCKRLVLAAGTIGNIKLIKKRNCINIPSIIDHAPYQIISMPFGNFKDTLNLKTPIVDIKKYKDSIYSEYYISKLSKKFLINSYGKFFGTMIYYLSRLIPISFWQVWTELTYVAIGRDVVNKRDLTNWIDIAYCCYSLIKNKRAPLFVINTKKGEGFHYISPELISLIKQSKEYSSCLSDDSLLFLGGSAMKKLPVYHPSFTFMAHAAWVGSNYTKI